MVGNVHVGKSREALSASPKNAPIAPNKRSIRFLKQLVFEVHVVNNIYQR